MQFRISIKYLAEKSRKYRDKNPGAEYDFQLKTCLNPGANGFFQPANSTTIMPSNPPEQHQDPVGKSNFPDPQIS